MAVLRDSGPGSLAYGAPRTCALFPHPLREGSVNAWDLLDADVGAAPIATKFRIAAK